MAKRKAVVTTIVKVCDNCGERIPTRGAKANHVEHQAITTAGSNGGWNYVLDFCSTKCKTEWIESHEADDSDTLLTGIHPEVRVKHRVIPMEASQ